MAKERLDSTDSEEAARVLNVALANRPNTFAAAFRAADGVLGRDISETPVSIAQLWLNDYGAAVNTQSAKIVANLLLGNASVLRGLSKKTRFQLISTFFPSFDLPRGWLTTARNGHITGDQIAAQIVDRLRRMDEGEFSVQSQMPFIRTLLSRPPRPTDAYREVLTPKQMAQIIEILTRRAPGELQKPETRAVILSWRMYLR